MSSALHKERLRAHPTRWLRGLHWRRYAALTGADAVSIVVSAALAVYWSLRGDMSFSVSLVAAFAALALVIKLPVFYLHGLYSMSWRQAGMCDLLRTVRAVTLGSLLLLAPVWFASRLAQWPPLHSLVPLDFIVTLFLVGGARLTGRALDELRRSGTGQQGRKVLIVGAGSAGEQVVRAIRNDKRRTYTPVGFIDDAPGKLGTSIQGVKVLGNRHDIPRIARTYQVWDLLIAIPSAGGPTIREIAGIARRAGFNRILTVPTVAELFSQTINLSKLQDLRPEDLIRREQVRISTEEVEGLLRDSVVLVTGAGGSIGSELCRQAARFGPRQLLLLERDETALFDIARRLHALFPDLKVRMLLADIRHRIRVERFLAEYRPQVIFHAAAYKHVPLMEENPADAISNNVIGTQVLAESAMKCGVERFVLISTDKAVNPSSVMGKTKRLAEMLVQEMNEAGETRFMAVRFGNVLGSRGSVVTIFKEQIGAGGPVTITHPEMRRYFMTSSEAVLLVLQAAAIGNGGEVFVLDMGKPIKILDLARDMIRITGQEPDVDIPIVFTGMRPGEKLFEDILSAEEGTVATKRDRIYIAKAGISTNGHQLVMDGISRLQVMLSQGDEGGLLPTLDSLISERSLEGSVSC